MAITDSSTGKTTREYSIEQLKQAANLMRGYDLVALCAAASGHAGGTLSIMDIAAGLYLKVADHDPKNPDWEDRDRVVWSTGHKGFWGSEFATRRYNAAAMSMMDSVPPACPEPAAHSATRS